MTPLESLIAAGTKLWLDSIDPDLVIANRAFGATGATSNPIIVSDLIKTGRFDRQLADLMARGLDDDGTAWQVTDFLVRQAQNVFLPVHVATKGDDGYVSFELDPLLEDPACPLSIPDKAKRYFQLGKESPDKYVAALARSDIQTNPPATNAAVQAMAAKHFTRTVDQLPSPEILAEIDRAVDFVKLEEVLMEEGLKKFADPQKALLKLIS